jgi:hypothetical protein
MWSQLSVTEELDNARRPERSLDMGLFEQLVLASVIRLVSLTQLASSGIRNRGILVYVMRVPIVADGEIIIY